ncbi:MAG: UPF0175 family protein [Bacteroidota bacterium]
MSRIIQVELPEDLLGLLNESAGELQQQIKFSLVTQLYLQQKVSLGKAAQLSGATRWQYEQYLAAQELPISLLGIEEVMADIQKLKAS